MLFSDRMREPQTTIFNTVLEAGESGLCSGAGREREASGIGGVFVRARRNLLVTAGQCCRRIQRDPDTCENSGARAAHRDLESMQFFDGL